MRCACIDIGSNTTRLLVGEAQGGLLREVMAQRAFVPLGAIGGGEIPAATLAQVASVVADQVQLARECGVRSVRVVATAAVRDAANGAALAAAVERAAAVPVTVLPPDEEARLAFNGVAGTLRGATRGGELGVVDVGGGSSELVVGTVAGGVRWSASLPVGSGALAAAHLHSDPPSAEELDAARAAVAAAFADVDARRPGAAYAVGGSATSLWRIAGPELSRETLERALHAIGSGPAAEIALRYELHPERVRVLPSALLLLDAARRALGCPLRIAAGGLREGVLLDELAAA